MGERRPARGTSLMVLLVDAAILNASFLAAFYLRFAGHIPAFNFVAFVDTSPWITLGLVAFYHFYSLYDLSPRAWGDVFSSIASGSILTFVSAVAVSFFLRGFSFPRSVFLIALLLQLALSGGWRRLVWLSLVATVKYRVLFVGTADEYQTYTGFSGLRHWGYEPRGLVLTERPPTPPQELPVLGLVEQLDDIVGEADCDVVMIGPGAEPRVRERALSAALLASKKVYLVPDLYDILVARAKPKELEDLLIFEVGAGSNGSAGKRLGDVLLSLAGLVITSPFLTVAALAILVDSPGPIIYRQQRVGEHGQEFTLYKLRTMRQDAEAKTGPVLASAGDERITRVGRVLRVLRLDELPQLWNVLKGDMSLIGPRPERPAFVGQYSREIPGYRLRHRVKAGITGLAQVSGKYSTRPEDKLRYDLYYAQSRSFWEDLRIILFTLKAVLTRGKAS